MFKLENYWKYWLLILIGMFVGKKANLYSGEEVYYVVMTHLVLNSAFLTIVGNIQLHRIKKSLIRLKRLHELNIDARWPLGLTFNTASFLFSEEHFNDNQLDNEKISFQRTFVFSIALIVTTPLLAFIINWIN